MKKILLAIFGAALLLVGCNKELETKVNDLGSRLTAVESQVAANKAAIEALQKANFITGVTPMADDAGWVVTISGGKELALYNGKDGAAGADGADGDAFFKSVVVEGDTVIITLTDDTVITVPFVVDFALELVTDELVVKPSAKMAVPYRVVGATDETKLHAVAGGNYKVEIDEAAGIIWLTTPAVLEDNSVVVMADRGDGKVSVKTLKFVGQVFETTTDFARAAYFWGDSFTVKVASNIHANVTADVPWITFEGTKATETYDVTVKIAVTPSCKARTGNIIVKDDAGVVIKNVAVTQGGCSTFFLNNQNAYATWEAAATALATGTTDGKVIQADGKVEVIISQDAELERIVFPANDAIKSIVIKPRFYGVPACDPSKVVVKGVTVPAGIPTTIENIVIRPDGNQVIAGINSGTYGTGIAILSGANTVNINGVIFDGTNEAYIGTTPTMIFDCGSAAGSTINITNCTADFGGCRGVQTYGSGTYVFDSNTLTHAYASYMMRIYDHVNVTFTNNLFDSENNLIDLRVGGNAHDGEVEPKVEDGKLVNDTNTYSDKVVRVYTSRFGSIYPGSTGGEGIVKVGSIKYPTVSAAIAKAADGAVIEVGEGEIDDNVKIPANKTLTIKGAAGTARDKVVINGNLEIAGSLTLSGLTLKTKEGVTNNVLGVADPSDGFAWGHTYLARIELGAHDVTFDNVRFVATAAVADLKNSMSMLWISQATNIKVLNSIFDVAADGAYCINQTHLADVLWSGNQFNGAGANAWAIRVMDKTVNTITSNEFNVTGQAIQIYSDFTGRLTLGNGVEDDNHYGPAVTEAVYSPFSLYELVSKGVTLQPINISLNAPTTAPAKDPEIELVWKHIDDTDWNATIDIANVRNIALNQDAMYLPCTAGHIYTLSLADGSLVKDQVLDDTEGHWPGLCGAATLSDGTVLLGTMALNTAKKFKVYTYDGTNLNVLVNMPGEDQYRLGDKITAAGTKDNMTIYAVDHKTGSANNGRYLTFKPGAEVLTAPTAIVPITGMGSNAGMAEIVPFADGKYYFELEGGKDDLIVTDGTDGASAKAITLGDLNADVNKRMTRGAKFFTAGGKNYMALIEMLGYNGANSFGATVRVYALPTNNPEVDLVGANAICTYTLPSPTASGNACGNLEVLKVGAKVYFGVGLKSAGVALLEFKY